MSTPGPGPAGTGGPADTPVPPTCFRHPGRETYVSCVRCGRPACPDCLRSAAVGQQCVECVRAGHQGGRPVSGMFGGRGGSRAAVVTWTLVALNILLYLVEWIRPGLANDMEMLGLGRFSANGPLDIIFNMWALIVVGPSLERTLGPVRYLTVYLVSAVGGSVIYYYLAPVSQPALGASGAIFGLLGAWFVVARRLRIDSRWLVAIVVLNLGFDLLLRSQIAWQAHVGGLLAGGLLTAAFVYAPRRQRVLLQAGAAVALVGVMAVAVAIRSHDIHQQLGF